MNLQTQRIFPTSIGISDNIIDNTLIKISNDYLDLYGSQAFLCPCTSTIRHHPKILEEKPFEQIKENIKELIAYYCTSVGYSSERIQISESWLNRYDEFGYQDLHHHHDSLISGVIYIQSKGNQDFVVQAPWHTHQPMLFDITNPSHDNYTTYSYPSTNGRCYIFPSYLMHRTLPATSKRISLSFNCVYGAR